MIWKRLFLNSNEFLIDNESSCNHVNFKNDLRPIRDTMSFLLGVNANLVHVVSLNYKSLSKIIV